MPAIVVSTKRKKGAGSEFHVSLDDGTTYFKVPGMESIPQIGGNAEYDEETRIDEIERSFTEKLETPAEVEIVMDDLPSDANQQLLINAAMVRAAIPARVLYANGRIADFSLELTDHYQGNAEVDNNLMCAVKGRVKAIAWSLVAP